MPKLPVVTPRRLVGVFEQMGFVIHRKAKSSHLIMKSLDGRRTTIPMHGRDIPNGTLLGILRDIKISKEDFTKLL